MEQEILKRLEAQEQLLQKVYVSAEKTRTYLLWTLIGSVALFILPLIGIAFVIPKFLSTLTTGYGI